jgi:hypothetical protein
VQVAQVEAYPTVEQVVLQFMEWSLLVAEVVVLALRLQLLEL